MKDKEKILKSARGRKKEKQKQWKLDDLVYFFKVLKEKAANMDLSPVKCISRRKAIKVLNKAEKIYYQ